MNHRHDLARLSTINQNSSLTRANTCDYDRMLWVDCAWSRQRTRITRVSLPANPCGRDVAVTAAGTPTYSVARFLAWLDERGYGAVSARGRGCRFLPSLPGPQDTVSESVAAEWAACFGVELEEIWGDAVHREEPRTDAPTQAAPVGGEPSPQSVLSVVPTPYDPPSTWTSPIRLDPYEVGKRAAEEEFVPAVLVDEPESFPCPTCSAPFATASQRGGHMRWCGVERPPARKSHHKRAPSAPVPIVPGESGYARTGHVGRVPVPERKRKMTAGMVPCPICQVPQLVLKGLRNHIRNAHHRDPDEMLGVPTYRQIKPIGDPVPAVVPPSDPSDVLSIGEWCEAHPRPKAPDADVDMRSPERRYLDLLLSWAERDGPNTDLLDRIEAMLAKVGTLAP